MPSVTMEHKVDPREALLAKVGDISGIEVFGNDLLVVIYQRPEKTKSGLYLPDVTREEDRYQSKCMLVLKMGSTCFIDENGKRFRDIGPGDWIVARPSDGWAITLNSGATGVSKQDAVDCRILSDLSVRARVSNPDLIY